MRTVQQFDSCRTGDRLYAQPLKNRAGSARPKIAATRGSGFVFARLQLQIVLEDDLESLFFLHEEVVRLTLENE